jgi:hypothetical protein
VDKISFCSETLQTESSGPKVKKIFSAERAVKEKFEKIMEKLLRFEIPFQTSASGDRARSFGRYSFRSFRSSRGIRTSGDSG